MARRTFCIRDPDQLAALTSPVRQQIVDAVCGLGPCSIGEIASAIGRPADGLYYHIRELVAVGLLLEAHEREVSGRREKVYRAPVRGILRLVYDPEDTENVEKVNRIVGGMLRTAERDFAAGFAQENVRVAGPDRNLSAARQTARLGKAQRRELNNLLQRIQEIFADAVRSNDDDGEFQSMTVVQSPLEDRPARRESS